MEDLFRLLLAILIALIWLALTFAQIAAEEFDQAEFGLLFFLAVAGHVTASQFRRNSAGPEVAARCASLVTLAYLIHRYRSQPTPTFEDHAWHFLRAVVVGWFCYGPLVFCMPLMSGVFSLAWRQLVALRWWLGRFAAWIVALRQLVARIPTPVQPPPTNASTASQVEIAKREYTRDCSLIRTAGLNSEEEQSLLTAAKQRYLRRLKELLP